ncbi:MAG: guanylate kinase [bacterium]
MANNKTNGLLFVIAAPSGAGKTTVTNQAIKRLNPEFDISKVRTSTTRQLRTGEIDGKDYDFLSIQEFEKREKEGLFLETTKYSGALYGSPISVLANMQKGKSFIIVTDLPGVHELKKTIPFATFIWITVPNIDELKNRLLKRETTDKNHVEKRLKLAEEEIKEAKKPRLFDFQMVNDIFEQTVEELCELIKNQMNK